MDVGALATALRRASGVIDVRASAERIAVSLRVLAPVVDASGAQPELARALRHASGRVTDATLILPAGSGQARVEFGNRQFVIPAALRDAILAALERPAAAGSSASLAAAGVADARRGSPAAQLVADDLAGGVKANALPVVASPTRAAASVAMQTAGTAPPSAGTRSAPTGLAALPTGSTPPPMPSAPTGPAALASAGNAGVAAAQRAPHTSFHEPLLAADGDAARAATQLRETVIDSGLFFESHLAAWSKGERPLDTLRQEAQQLRAGDLREPHARDIVAPPPRAGAQIDVLTRDAVHLHGPLWPGQAGSIELQRDAATVEADERNAQSEATQPVFSATLRLDLPALGPMTVRLRLAGTAVTATVAADAPERVAAELPQLAAHFEARGLQPVALRALAHELRADRADA